MAYQYENNFYLEKSLAEALSKLISKKEGIEYVCKDMVITIPEHKGEVFYSPLDGYNPWGGGLNALSGAQISAINEKYGKYIPGTIPAESYEYFVVIAKNNLEKLKRRKFKSREEIEKALTTLCTYYAEHFDISFDAASLVQRFPYLSEFFSSLDEWRAKTRRVTLDDNVIDEGVKKVLTPQK